MFQNVTKNKLELGSLVLALLGVVIYGGCISFEFQVGFFAPEGKPKEGASYLFVFLCSVSYFVLFLLCQMQAGIVLHSLFDDNAETFKGKVLGVAIVSLVAMYMLFQLNPLLIISYMLLFMGSFGVMLSEFHKNKKLRLCDDPPEEEKTEST